VLRSPFFPRPCTPQSCPFDDTDGQYEPGISDIGLCFLDQPVLGIRPAKLATAASTMSVSLAPE